MVKLKTTNIAIGIVLIAIVIVTAILVIQLNGPTGAVMAQEKIRIGVFTMLSGDGAMYGQSMKKGLDLAMEDINNAGGVLGTKIELVYEDTRLDSKEAVTAMNKFIHIDKFPIVISAEGSGATSAAAPLADSTKTVMMVGVASTPTIKDAGDYVFRVVPSDAYQGTEIARLAKELGYKKAGILYVNDAYGVGIKDIFSSKFRKIVIEEAFESGDSDFKTQLTKIKAKNPDVIVIVARKEFPVILKQAKELGLNAQIIGSETLKDESIIQASGNAAEGVLMPFFAEVTDYVGYKDKFQQRYGTEPTIYSEYGYDALGVLGVAIEKAGSTDSEKVKDALYDTVFYGATGVVQFDSYGEVTEKPFVIYKVVDGEIREFRR